PLLPPFPTRRSSDLADREAAWQVLRWLQRPENAGRFPLTAGHVVSPLKNPAASDLAQKQYRDQFRIDPKAFLLQAQNARPAGWRSEEHTSELQSLAY